VLLLSHLSFSPYNIEECIEKVSSWKTSGKLW
jgi:hypothetical protein